MVLWHLSGKAGKARNVSEQYHCCATWLPPAQSASSQLREEGCFARQCYLQRASKRWPQRTGAYVRMCIESPPNKHCETSCRRAVHRCNRYRKWISILLPATASATFLRGNDFAYCKACYTVWYTMSNGYEKFTRYITQFLQRLLQLASAAMILPIARYVTLCNTLCLTVAGNLHIILHSAIPA